MTLYVFLKLTKIRTHLCVLNIFSIWSSKNDDIGKPLVAAHKKTIEKTETQVASCLDDEGKACVCVPAPPPALYQPETFSTSSHARGTMAQFHHSCTVHTPPPSSTFPSFTEPVTYTLERDRGVVSLYYSP
jgi:hypothetical protein